MTYQSPFSPSISSHSPSFPKENGLIPIVNRGAKSNYPDDRATHAIFQPLVATLLAQTRFPVRLPTYIPATEEAIPLYGILETVNASSYQLLLAFSEDCTGGNACRFGGVSGKSKSASRSPLSGQKVALEGDLTGYFTPSVCGANCSDAILAWEQEGDQYTVAIKAGKVEELIPMANSAILAIPLHAVAPTSPETVKVQAKFTISSQGIGEARLGMIYGQLKSKLRNIADFKPKNSLIVDFNAIAVYQSGQVQYYILYPAGETFQDSDAITVLLTDNPQYRTAEGIGPGISLEQAEKIYGKATLFYNTNGESREYVSFAKQPFSNIHFRPVHKKDGFVGIYQQPIQEYNQTTTFQEGATIRSVEVIAQPKP